MSDIAKLIAKRPPPDGTDENSKVVDVRANFLEVKKFNYPTVKSYTLEITVQRAGKVSKKDSDAVVIQLIKNKRFGQRAVAYDGQLLYSINDVTDGRKVKDLTVTVRPIDDAGSPKTYKVVIKFSADISLRPMADYVKAGTSQLWDDKIQNIFTVLNAFLTTKVRTRYLSLGKKAIFPEPSEENRIFLYGGVELMRGFYQSIRPGWEKLLVNVDVCATVYYPSGPLIHRVPKILYETGKELRTKEELMRGLSNQDVDVLTRFLKDHYVTTTIRVNNEKEKFKVLKVSYEPAERLRKSRNSQITVSQYYSNIGQNLQYPKLPCVVVKKSRFEEYLPIEICSIISGFLDQKYRTDNLSELQRKDMIEKTAIKPKDRFERIQYAINDIYKYQNDEIIKSIGMEVNNRFIELKSRLLKAPQLITYESKEITPDGGNWEVKKFVKPLLSTLLSSLQGSVLANWSVVSFEDSRILREQEIINALKLLIEALTQKGIDVPSRPKISFANRQGSISQSLLVGVNNINKSNPKLPRLMICIVPHKLSSKNGIYQEIKKCCAIELGVISQCIVGSHMKGKQGKWRQICANLALKINGKLGGTNSTLARREMSFFERDSKEKASFLLNKFMFFGADVFHPDPEDKKKGRPSVAALCASMNPEATKYVSRYCMNQELNNESIEDICRMVSELMEQYKINNNDLPDQIVFYRDGIAEGQFEKIMREEVMPIENELKKIYGSRDPPKFTFVIVQKRHHARFVPVNESEADPQGKNCKPGTVIDTGIVVPQYFTFFLQSHASPLGTARSTYYHVIRNGGNFKANEMYNLTYKLCFLSVRCNLSICHVTPVHYAHHIANHAKHFVQYEEYPDP
ncbi:14538_t:CDS:10, partial [Acaulospora morrowiae]